MLDFLSDENTLYCSKLPSEKLIAGKKTEKPSGEPPTDQCTGLEIKLTTRTVSS